ncbi:Na(+)/dicarboxylate cotransporter 3-like [Glandiceps talaboti]
MSVVGFLSMWILNVPLLIMMLPIVKALVEQLEKRTSLQIGRCEDGAENGKSKGKDKGDNVSDNADVSIEMEVLENGIRNIEGIGGRALQETEMDVKYKSTVALVTPETSKEISSLQTSFYLGLTYSSTIGGAASLFGTLTQVIMVSFLESDYGPEGKISFGGWMLFSLPVQIVCLLICWAWLTFFYLSKGTCRRSTSFTFTPEHERNKEDEEETIADGLRREYDGLGPIKWAEVVILVVFGCLILVWFFENPSFMNGWASFFKPGYVTSATITMGIISVCFALPSTRPSCNVNGITTTGSYEPLLDWKYVQKNIDWGILLFAGGLFSIAQALKVSKLDGIVGQQFEIIQTWSPMVVLFSATLISIVTTEILGASIMITLLMPILELTAANQGVHPYYYILGTTLGLNFSFCLPAGNMGSAIIVTGGYIKITQLLKSGIFLNIACLVVVNIAMNTYAGWVLQLDTIPEWALRMNETTTNITPTIPLE